MLRRACQLHNLCGLYPSQCKNDLANTASALASAALQYSLSLLKAAVWMLVSFSSCWYSFQALWFLLKDSRVALNLKLWTGQSSWVFKIPWLYVLKPYLKSAESSTPMQGLSSPWRLTQALFCLLFMNIFMFMNIWWVEETVSLTSAPVHKWFSLDSRRGSLQNSVPTPVTPVLLAISPCQFRIGLCHCCCPPVHLWAKAILSLKKPWSLWNVILCF